MTMLVSAVGVVGRIAGELLTSALAWASSLLFGRVPKSHQRYLILMMAASLLWIVTLFSLLIPRIAGLLLSTTPHPALLNTWLVLGLALAVIVLPLCVGLCGYLVPTEGERPEGFAIVLELLRGYILAPVISGILMFLTAVGLARKVRSLRHGWSDTHLPIVVKPGAYDQLVTDLQHALASADIKVAAKDAPWVLTLPARVLTTFAGDNVRKLRPDRLIELTGRGMRIGVYPSDIAISGKAVDQTRARAAMVSRLATTSAHLTMSAEAQKVEDQLAKLASPNGHGPRAVSKSAFEEIDRRLTELPVSTDEWDTLYRMRLQIERDVLARKGSRAPRSST
jgi:MFS family permease